MADPLVHEVVGNGALVGLLERLFGDDVRTSASNHMPLS